MVTTVLRKAKKKCKSWLCDASVTHYDFAHGLHH